MDNQNTYKLLEHSSQKPFCSPFQREQLQADGFPRLKASPRSQIIAQYLENGHISSPPVLDSDVGNVYWFGTNVTSVHNITLGEVQSWKNVQGRGRRK